MKQKDIDEKTSYTLFSNFIDVIKSKDVESLRRLLKQKNIVLVDSQHQSVLHVAARLGDAEIVKTLLEDWKVARLLDKEMYHGETPLILAARYNNVDVVKALADFGANVWKHKLEFGNTILHLAARLQDTELMNALIARNPSEKVLNRTNDFGETALDTAIMESSATLEILLQAGADYSKPNKLNGRNVLHTCVAYKQCKSVGDLVTSRNSRDLVNLVDSRGDTPLMLAVRTACFECVQSMIMFLNVGKEINEKTGESLLHMAVATDSDDILKYILMFSHETIINHVDFHGRTPLLLSVEREKAKCFNVLIYTQNIYVTNKMTQDTVLHTAIRVNNTFALSALMSYSNSQAIFWWLAQKDFEGKTPLWLAIEYNNDLFIIEARKQRWIDINELNQFHDSTIYVAAARGHIKILKALMMSDKFYEFCSENISDIDTKGEELIREAEVCFDIYTSDIFVMANEVRTERLLHCWIPNCLLHSSKKSGRNVFHACAIGGSKVCLEFIHTFVKLFKFDLRGFDRPDHEGNTPLLLATRNNFGGPECTYFFLSHGSNILSSNNSGDHVLMSMLTNTENSVDVLTALLNAGISYDTNVKGLLDEREYLQIDFSLFMPPGNNILTVVKQFYDKIYGAKRNLILQHVLFKTYVHLVTNTVKYIFLFRFVMSCFHTMLLAVFIILYMPIANEITGKSQIVFHLRSMMCVINVLGITFSVPLLISTHYDVINAISAILMILPCVLNLILLSIPPSSDFYFEIGALAALVSWPTFMMYSSTVFREISHQVAMLSQVVYGMFIYMGTVFMTMFAFSLAFYCIFNDSFYFVSPLKSFIYTYSILLLEEFDDSFNFFENKHIHLLRRNNTGDIIQSKRDILYSHFDLYFECAILLGFIITVTLGLMNMLVSLAVRDAKTLEAGGDIFRRRIHIHWLSNLEEFLNSYIYKKIRHTPLVYVFGIIPSRTFMDVDIVYAPMVDKRPSPHFTNKSVQEMKKSVVRLRGAKRVSKKDYGIFKSF